MIYVIMQFLKENRGYAPILLSFHFLLLSLVLSALVWASNSVCWAPPIFMGCIYTHTTRMLRTAAYMCVSSNMYLFDMKCQLIVNLCVSSKVVGKCSALTEGQGHELVESSVKGRTSGVLVWPGCCLLPSVAMPSFFSVVKILGLGGFVDLWGTFQFRDSCSFLKTSQLRLLYRDFGMTSVFNLKGKDFQALTVIEEWFQGY